MTRTAKLAVVTLVMAAAMIIVGCSEQNARIDTATPVAQLKQDIGDMSEAQLRRKAITYREAIKKKHAQAMASLGAMSSATEPSEADKIKVEVNDLMAEVKPLTQRYYLYFNELKARGSDLTGVRLNDNG